LSAAIASIAMIDVPRRISVRARQRVLTAFADTTRYILQRRALATCIGAMCVASALGMPILQLTPLFATDVFDVGPGGFGILAGALGFGGAASAPVLGGWTQHIPSGRLIAGSLLGYGLAIVAFAQAPSFPLAVVAMVFVGAGFLFASSTVISVLQLGVADELRGSVAAVFSTAFAVAYPIGSLVQGWASDHVGPRLTVTVAGAGVAVAAIYMATSRRIQSELRGSAHTHTEPATAVATTAQL
jgi:predicted MFS family arabinose efflux permease